MNTKSRTQFLIIIDIIGVLLISALLAKIAFWDVVFQTILTVASIVLALWYSDLGKPRLKLEII